MSTPCTPATRLHRLSTPPLLGEEGPHPPSGRRVAVGHTQSLSPRLKLES